MKTDWQATNGLSGANPGDDSDCDGLKDLLEYALGGDPNDPADRPAPTLADDKFSFRHLPERTDVECIMETSTDLDGWNAIATIRAAGLPNDIDPGYTLESDGGHPETLSISPAPPVATAPWFVRLKVAQR